MIFVFGLHGRDLNLDPNKYRNEHGRGKHKKTESSLQKRFKGGSNVLRAQPKNTWVDKAVNSDKGSFRTLLLEL